MKINKFAFKLSALAVAAMSSAGAFATGTISAPVAAVVYAMEGVYQTPIVLPPVTYTMGVGRGTTGQDMTIIYTLPAGTTFGTVPTSLTYAGASGTVTSTIKRGGVGTSQVVYSVSIGAVATIAGETFTLGGGAFGNASVSPTGLTSASTLPIAVKLLDQVETACVDNVGTPADGSASECKLTSTYGTLARAADFWNTVTPAAGVASDSATTTNVLATVPLAGFVVQAPDDIATTAAATVQVKTSNAGGASVRNSANAADYALVAGDLVTITVTDPTNFLGLAAGGLAFDTVNVFSVVGNTATLANLAGTNASFNADKLVTYLSDATTPLGTSRVLSIAGSVAPLSGIAHDFTGNSTWWTWDSNGIVLETPMSAVTAGYNNRFVFMNYGTSAATVTAECLVESGKTVTNLLTSVAPLNLTAGTQTVVTADQVCTVTGTGTGPTALGNAAARAGVRFTINAPTNTVKGVYNSVNSNTGAIDSIEMLPIRNANPV